jgi:hypothetical protein
LADAAVALVRALRSLIIIAVVALAISAARNGSLGWPKLAQVVVLNRTLFVMVFLGLSVWEFWYRRAKRHHAIDPREIR